MEPISNTPQQEIKRAISGADLLTRLNAMSETFQYGRFKSLPEISPEASKILGGVRITIVDDLADVLMHVGADLLVATEGNISLLYHTTQSFEELVEQIVATSPELVLMDGALRRGMKGADLITSLTAKLPGTCMVAHSGDDDLNQEMLKVGAFGFISKMGGDVQVDRIAHIYKQFQQQRCEGEQPLHDLSNTRLSTGSLDRSVEVLCSLSMLLQAYLLSHATPAQRVEMGVPEGFLDESVLNASQETYKSPSWWLAPFEGIKLGEELIHVSEQCPSLSQFIDHLYTTSVVALTWEEADLIHRQIQGVIEG